MQHFISPIFPIAVSTLSRRALSATLFTPLHAARTINIPLKNAPTRLYSSVLGNLNASKPNALPKYGVFVQKRGMAIILPKKRIPQVVKTTGSSGQGGGGGGYKGTTYSTPSSQFMRRFATAGIILGGGFTVYYLTHLDKVPISGRTRMVGISPESEVEMGQMTWEQVKAQHGGKFLPASNQSVKMVKRVIKPIIDASGLSGLEWEVVVIESPEVNAFVIPGGKVCVFSGLFKVIESEDMLAAVLAHEVGHVVARHGAEGMTWGRLLMIAAWGISVFFELDSTVIPQMILTYFVQLPKSRKMESEADHIGLLLMSKACFNPNAAVAVWKNFSKIDQEKGRDNAIFPYLSTHPSSERRIEDIQSWMSEASAARESSHCESFKRVASGWGR